MWIRDLTLIPDNTINTKHLYVSYSISHVLSTELGLHLKNFEFVFVYKYIDGFFNENENDLQNMSRQQLINLIFSKLGYNPQNIIFIIKPKKYIYEILP